jgi:hypothetical protein
MGYLLIGAAVGAAVSAVYAYLFAPAQEATFDAGYRSRWDWAIEEGNRAAAAHELEMRSQFEQAKLPQPRTEL